MIRPLSLFIGLRYTRARRRNHFISFISLISMLGIAMGIMALITVLSVMNGFEKELRARILGVVSHVTIQDTAGGLRDWSALMEQVEANPSVIGGAPYIHAEGMLSNGAKVGGSIIRGILPEREGQVSVLNEKMIMGELSDLKAGHFGIVLGKELAYALKVGLGDKVTLITPQTNITAIGMLPRLKRFTVVGVFEAGMYEYDSALALLHIDDAAVLFQTRGGVTGLRLKLDDMMEAPRTARQFSYDFQGQYQVSDWTRQHANFFRAVKTEKTVMFIILLLIVAVAAFNLVSTLVMMVTDKHSDIAILRTLGASPANIMMIFIVQGAVTGIVGTLLGVLGGVVLAQNIDVIVPFIERLLNVDFLAADVYYISDLPSDMRLDDVLTIGIVAFLMTLCATLYPAWHASRIQPAEALRYE